MKSVAAEEDRGKSLIVYGLKELEGEQLPVQVQVQVGTRTASIGNRFARLGYWTPLFLGLRTLAPVLGMPASYHPRG